MSYYRTPEHRARQAAAIQQWRPWEHSTGPKSEEGKARVSRNAYKGGTRAMLREGYDSPVAPAGAVAKVKPMTAS